MYIGTAVLLILAAIIFAGFVWFYFNEKRRATASKQNEGIQIVLTQLNELARVIDTKIGENTRQVSESARVQTEGIERSLRELNQRVTDHLMHVVKGVTETGEASKKIFALGEQLQNLERVLTHQKQRGNLGEASLELILGNILPPAAYRMQYMFADKAKVDAVIVTKDGMIPVDAKFSLDNYTRMIDEIDEERKALLKEAFTKDMKNRINETAKYIRPEEHTLPFAFMFIPAEAIYYDLLTNTVGMTKSHERSLIDYAYNDKKVIVVSPTTFAAYLQSVLYGFKAFKIEESAQMIIQKVRDLAKHLKSYEEYQGKLGGSLSTVVSHFNTLQREFKKIDKDVEKIGGESTGVSMEMLEKPE